MHRFFVPPTALQETKAVLQGDVAHQIYRVLRMRPGERVVVLDDSGWEFEVELIQVEREEAVGGILGKQLAGGEPHVRITLYQSLLKRDNFEWVLQKCTEIGVVEFVPMVSRRTMVSSRADVKASKVERWRRIILEAAEQSRRGRLPVLREALRFEEALAEVGASPALAQVGTSPALAEVGARLALAEVGASPALAEVGASPALAEVGASPALAEVGARLALAQAGAGASPAPTYPMEKFDLCLIPWEEEKNTGLRVLLPAAKLHHRDPVSIALFIGPEGGFAEEEIALARGHGAITVTLGPRIFRAETAAVVAASLILYEFGELE